MSNSQTHVIPTENINFILIINIPLDVAYHQANPSTDKIFFL